MHAIVDTGSYGERGMDSFRAGATELNICIDGDVHKISRRWTDDQFEYGLDGGRERNGWMERGPNLCDRQTINE